MDGMRKQGDVNLSSVNHQSVVTALYENGLALTPQFQIKA